MKIKEIKSNKEIIKILYEFDHYFIPTIHEKVQDIKYYADKLSNNAYVFVAYSIGVDGFISFYANDMKNKVAYVSFIAVHENSRNKSVGTSLITACKNKAIKLGMKFIKLEVRKITLVQ